MSQSKGLYTSDERDNLSYIKFNYDDDTYEIIDKDKATKYHESNKNQKYIQTVEKILDQRRQKRKLKAIQFLKELNRNKKKAIVHRILMSNDEKILKKESSLGNAQNSDNQNGENNYY